MDRLRKIAIIINLLNRMKEKGSWCGETHIHKTIYFLQELTGVPLEFNYILYKHGPFSFDLRDELSAMRCDGMIKKVSQNYPYGPSLVPTDPGINVHDYFPKTTAKYAPALAFVAEKLGDKRVVELERMGTALLVILENKDKEVDNRWLASEIHSLKPHVPPEKALAAVETVKIMMEEVANSIQQ
jgi:hypothetical protein